jgi:plasmid stabilization system protein ParE
MNRPIKRSTPRADADIDEVALFLCEKAVELGIRFYDAVSHTVDQISKTPGIGSPNRLPHIQNTTIRVWPVQDFPNVLLLYMEIPGGIEIIRVLHARRNWPLMMP